jgi:hypothetical protein
MLAHWEQALVDIGFLDPAAPKKLMPRLNQLFNRAQLAQEEVHILRGVAKAMSLTAKRGRTRQPPRPLTSPYRARWRAPRDRLAPMFSRLRSDIQCILDRDPAARSTWEVLTCYPGLHALCCTGRRTGSGRTAQVAGALLPRTCPAGSPASKSTRAR